MTTLQETLDQRTSVYGDFSDNAEAAQDIKAVFDQHIMNTTGHETPSFVYEALDLIATKLSRIVTGDPYYLDNWHDIAGYAKLVEDRLAAVKPTEDTYHYKAVEITPGLEEYCGADAADSADDAPSNKADSAHLVVESDDALSTARKTAVENENAALRAKVEKLTAQLPPEMQNCTIRFVECVHGHGRLTAANWIDIGCETCVVSELHARLRRIAYVGTGKVLDEVGHQLRTPRGAGEPDHEYRKRLLCHATLGEQP